MSKKKPTVRGDDWKTSLIEVLINAGLSGIEHKDLLGLFKQVATADQLKQELEALWVEDKVQKFDKPTKGKSGQLWRATSLILE